MVGPILAGQVLGRFWSGRAEVAQIPDRLHAEGPFRLLRCCRRRRSRCRGFRVSVRPGAVAYPGESVSVAVFAREVFFLSSHPDSRGVEGESLRTPRTQWRCLSLPPIPSIRMLVSALAARCPPASGLQARSAHFLRTFWIPGPGPNPSLFLRFLP